MSFSKLRIRQDKDCDRSLLHRIGGHLASVKSTTHCAVILTALPVEYEAVRAHLTNLREETHPQGTIYERGNFSTMGRSWEIGIVEIGAGNAGAAFEAERAINYFKPSLVLFVGVAGGLKDVGLGDVVAATKVYAYESGKAKAKFSTRPVVGKPSYPLEQRARAEAKKNDWLQRINGPVPVSKPRVFVAPIAAGEKVVASTRSSVRLFLNSSYSDALAVEMEGHGFLLAASANQVEALIIRGISDLIDNKSQADAANWQEIAARHASAFAFEVLAKIGSNKYPQNEEKAEGNNLPERRSEVITAPWEEQDVVNFFETCYLMLLLDQYNDGAWARSLWYRSGTGYTTDLKVDQVIPEPHQKKALSVTSAAALALYSYAPDSSRWELAKARDFLLTHRDANTGAYGNHYSYISNAPGIQPISVHRGNPRHTGTAIKYFLVADGFNRITAEAINYLLKNQNTDGGWGEGLNESSNCLAVAYVLDALWKAFETPEFRSFLLYDELKDLQIAIQRGLAWLAKHQQPNGRWRYGDSELLEPYYTTDVLAHVHQLSVDYPSVWERGIEALLKLRKENGGIPYETTGSPDLPNTCNFAFVLSKQDDRYFDALVEVLTFLFATIKDASFISQWYMNTSIFGLPLHQIQILSGYNLHKNDAEIEALAKKIREKEEIYKNDQRALGDILPIRLKHLLPSIEWVFRIQA